MGRGADSKDRTSRGGRFEIVGARVRGYPEQPGDVPPLLRHLVPEGAKDWAPFILRRSIDWNGQDTSAAFMAKRIAVRSRWR